MKRRTSTGSGATWRAGSRQLRSQRTEAALASAAADLMRHRNFEDITVADIARRAGVAVGTVYRRFRDKRALLHLADTSFVDDCRDAFDVAFSDEQVRGLTLDGVVRRYIELMVRKFREHRDAVLQIQRNADLRDGAVYARRAAEFNAHVHGRFRALLRGHHAAAGQADPETTLNLAIFFASSAARDAIWRGALKAYPVTVDDARLVDELTRAFLAYLRA